MMKKAKKREERGMEQRRKTQRTQTIRYLVSLLLYGTNGMAAHFLQLSSMQIVLLRTSFGWLVLTLALLLGQKTRQSAQRQDVLFVLLSGVCSTGLGSYLYFSSIPRLPVREVSVLGYVEPLSALVFSAVLLGKRLLPAQLLGAGLILGGTLVMELFRAKI